eukprot:TRINITY_DN15938_c0_g1_i2.p1 TRINITY_DN15938_c0_g1~~TRINITY_DN15938_c0_g1_i2.p1  ORF type:complete len:131 (+),score=41.23 TRINITY_DN15938_c0_g1_i2:112-504(+)
MIRRPPRSTLSSSSAASDVYKRQVSTQSTGGVKAASMATKHAAVLKAASKIFGRRAPPKSVWTDLAEGKINHNAIKDMNWYYMPSLKTLRCPLYVDSKEENNQLRTERLQRRNKGPPKKGQGRRAARAKK